MVKRGGWGRGDKGHSETCASSWTGVFQSI